ncbi:aminotransferase class I/II-fold pyridoxal phosphate-dependent enzyme [Plebeiibacterium marinum]|uniref:GDP-perosamine synthase n=1 Tax=Plebeiibacterium marinum TaxID=2992111 RepID=A0AAE3SI85_9BACT|nr:aminotransferase class I/II-fold pyridoxal phosphate-dependent enzyme [Plebeiobacterium marinum]MCW3804129.1 aminotransferase class I/II-fold pyridoxal phosphate-dependent enzyme [Plebeiobacterium marinum]
MLTNELRVFLSPPNMSGNEQKYINEAFDQNWIAPLGPNVDAFEEDLSSYCNVRSTAALSSGTAALHLAMILLGVNSGDEVMVSTFTFSATVNPIVYQGAMPVFIDSETTTWNMDPELLREALMHRKKNGNLNKVKAIVVVHLYGMPAKMAEIMEISEEFGIPVIEDAAEALGSTYSNKPLGSFGKMSILSFNGNKIITTSGGGALLANDDELIRKARFLATQARDNAPHYQHSHIGYNYRMSNVLAGIGRGQLEVIDERVKQKREVYSYYYQQLCGIDGIEFLEEPDGRFFSNRWLTTMIIDSKKIRVNREIIQEKLEKVNIETRPLWKPMHLQPIFKHYPKYLNSVSEKLFDVGLCLPSGSDLSDDTLERILGHLKEILIK